MSVWDPAYSLNMAGLWPGHLDVSERKPFRRQGSIKKRLSEDRVGSRDLPRLASTAVLENCQNNMTAGLVNC